MVSLSYVNALKYISDKVNGEFSQLDNQKIHALTEEALQHVLPQVQFNLMDSNAYYRYVSKRIGVIVESTLKALRYQNENTKFRPWSKFCILILITKCL